MDVRFEAAMIANRTTRLDFRQAIVVEKFFLDHRGDALLVVPPP
jgi:hypothetical protein